MIAVICWWEGPHHAIDISEWARGERWWGTAGLCWWEGPAADCSPEGAGWAGGHHLQHCLGLVIVGAWGLACKTGTILPNDSDYNSVWLRVGEVQVIAHSEPAHTWTTWHPPVQGSLPGKGPLSPGMDIHIPELQDILSRVPCQGREPCLLGWLDRLRQKSASLPPDLNMDP